MEAIQRTTPNMPQSEFRRGQIRRRARGRERTRDASDPARRCELDRAAMTVTYSPRELLVFSHLKGTVLPEVWRMCAFTCALAYALCHIYNPIRRTVRDGGPKTIVRPPARSQPPT